jgi:hypothetical protein
MPILTIVLTIVIVGVLMWLINTFIPMPRAIKTLLNIIVLVILILWVLQSMGILTHLRF